jgi:hypothetical protein
MSAPITSPPKTLTESGNLPISPSESCSSSVPISQIMTAHPTIGRTGIPLSLKYSFASGTVCCPK